MTDPEKRRIVRDFKERGMVTCKHVEFDGAGHYCMEEECPAGVHQGRRVFCFGRERTCEFRQHYERRETPITVTQAYKGR